MYVGLHMLDMDYSVVYRSQVHQIPLILWRICHMKELLSHGNLETRTQQYNCECL
jgi:hypothetical protein